MLLLFLILALILSGGAFIAFLIWSQRSRRQRDLERGLSMVTLRIQPPPLSEDNTSEHRDDKSVLEENIAKATTLYNLLAATASKETWRVKHYKQQHFGFEIVAHHNQVDLYAVVPQALVSIVRQALVSAYRGVNVDEVEDHNLFDPELAVDDMAVGQLGLRKHFAYPVLTYLESQADVMKVILEACGSLAGAGGVGLQIMIRPAGQAWTEAAQAIAKQLKKDKSDDNFGKELLMGAFRPPADKKESKPDISSLDQKAAEAIEKKSVQPGFEVLIRLVVATDNKGQSQVIYQNLIGAFKLLDAPQHNGFKEVKVKDASRLIQDFNLRLFPKQNQQVILSSDELATLFHLPNQDNMPTSQLRRVQAKQIDGPRDFLSDGLLLGHNVFRNQRRPVILGDKDRLQHMYVVGQTGTGKSVFLENLVKQDLRDGKGFAFIDPHGETAETVLSLIPKDRLDDVIYFNPGNLEFPLGLNMFEHDNADQQDILIQEAILMLYKLYDPQKQGIIGPRYEYMFRNAAKLIMADPAGGTFIDIPKLFNNRALINQKLKHVTDKTLIDFWTKEIVDQARSNEFGDIKAWFVSKFSAFLSNAMMRNIIGQTKSSFNLRQVMDEGKILIVNIGQGLTGELNMKLLGMIFVTKFQMAAMSRADIPASQRQPFTVYIDEFQNFATESFTTILSAARKYKLALVVANQHTTQLSEEIRDSVYGNVGTAVAFRINAEDAEHMAKQFYGLHFSVDDLTRLPTGHTIIRTLIKGAPTIPFNMNTQPPTEVDLSNLAEVQRILQKQSRTRKQVEAEIFKRLEVPQPPALKDAQALLKNLRQRRGAAPPAGLPPSPFPPSMPPPAGLPPGSLPPNIPSPSPLPPTAQPAAPPAGMPPNPLPPGSLPAGVPPPASSPANPSPPSAFASNWLKNKEMLRT